jgi:hypothetical protein
VCDEIRLGLLARQNKGCQVCDLVDATALPRAYRDVTSHGGEVSDDVNMCSDVVRPGKLLSASVLPQRSWSAA